MQCYWLTSIANKLSFKIFYTITTTNLHIVTQQILLENPYKWSSRIQTLTQRGVIVPLDSRLRRKRL